MVHRSSRHGLSRSRRASPGANNRLTNLRPAFRNAVAAAHYQQSEPGHLEVAASTLENRSGCPESELFDPNARHPGTTLSRNTRGFLEALPRQGASLRPLLEQRPRHRKLEGTPLRLQSRISGWGIQRPETTNPAELKITAPPKAFSCGLETRSRQPHTYWDRPKILRL